MNENLKECKHAIRQFMREQYSNERLVALLDHARNGHLRYESCCCFVGAATANHNLAIGRHDFIGTHYHSLPSSITRPADAAYFCLADHIQGVSDNRYANTADTVRRRIIIPMILAELKRRRQEQPKEVREELMANSGVTIVEYAVMLALIAIALVAAVPGITSAVVGVFDTAASVME